MITYIIFESYWLNITNLNTYTLNTNKFNIIFDYGSQYNTIVTFTVKCYTIYLLTLFHGSITLYNSITKHLILISKC
jgi:hypothetical protein